MVFISEHKGTRVWTLAVLDVEELCGRRGSVIVHGHLFLYSLSICILLNSLGLCMHLMSFFMIWEYYFGEFLRQADGLSGLVSLAQKAIFNVRKYIISAAGIYIVCSFIVPCKNCKSSAESSRLSRHVEN